MWYVAFIAEKYIHTLYYGRYNNKISSPDEAPRQKVHPNVYASVYVCVCLFACVGECVRASVFACRVCIIVRMLTCSYINKLEHATSQFVCYLAPSRISLHRAHVLHSSSQCKQHIVECTCCSYVYAVNNICMYRESVHLQRT